MFFVVAFIAIWVILPTFCFSFPSPPFNKTIFLIFEQRFKWFIVYCCFRLQHLFRYTFFLCGRDVPLHPKRTPHRFLDKDSQTPSASQIFTRSRIEWGSSLYTHARARYYYLRSIALHFLMIHITMCVCVCLCIVLYVFSKCFSKQQQQTKNYITKYKTKTYPLLATN